MSRPENSSIKPPKHSSSSSVPITLHTFSITLSTNSITGFAPCGAEMSVLSINSKVMLPYANKSVSSAVSFP